MKILIIQTAFIGDVVLATPVIEKLHHYYPEAQIDFLLKKGNETLFSNHPYVNKVFVFDKKQGKYKNLFALVKQVRKEKYDWVINLHRFFSSGLIAAMSGAKNIAGFDKNPMSGFYTHKVKHEIDTKNGDFHEVRRNIALVSRLTDSEPVKPKLYPSAKDFQKVKTEGEYVCMAPASMWFTKQFPAAKWVELINKLDPKYTVYLLGAKSDMPLCEDIKAQTQGKKVVILAGELSFLESAALIKNARMSFVNDSAPLHFASSMNAPVAAIFCSTVPEFGFGPLSDTSYVIQVDEPLACKPCGLHGHKACPLGHFKCADIKIEKILAATNIN